MEFYPDVAVKPRRSRRGYKATVFLLLSGDLKSNGFAFCSPRVYPIIRRQWRMQFHVVKSTSFAWKRQRLRHYRQHGKSKPWGELSRELTEWKRTEPWLYDFDSQMLEQALAYLKQIGRAHV